MRAVWNVDQARRFLESAREDDDPLYAGYVLMLVLGLRRGELLGLAGVPVISVHAIREALKRLGSQLGEGSA